MTIAHIVFVPPPPPVPGLRITSHRGTITASTSKMLTGQAITSSKGTLVPLKTGLPITGKQIVSHQGALALTISTGSLPLTGQVITSTRGAITPMRPIVGLKSTSAKGTLGKQRTHALTGLAITSRMGTPVTLNITDTSVPDAQVGVPYSFQFTPVGYSSLNNLLWALDAASPNTGGWLQIYTNIGQGGNPGTIYGTPTRAETENITVGVGDSASQGQQFDKSFTFNVTGQTLNFPLLGGYLIGGSTQPLTAARIAPLGVCVLGAWEGWTNNSGQNPSQLAAAAKAINPNFKMTIYSKPATQNQSGMPADLNTVNSVPWWLYVAGTSGTQVTADASEGPGTMINITQASKLSGGQHYPAWRAGRDIAVFLTPFTAVDGIYLDNVFSLPRVSGDWGLLGSSQSPTVAQAAVRTGYAAYATAFYAQSRANQQQCWANTADWYTNSNGFSVITEYMGVFNGGVLEGINGQENNAGWARLMAHYKACMNALAAPKYGIFSVDFTSSNYVSFRYFFCSCLLDNAYYYHSQNGTYNDYITYDEFSFNLGAPLAGPGNPTNGVWSTGAITAWKQGVYRRDFQNGIVLVNPRGNGAQTVVIDAVNSFWHLRGTQDATVNNHAQIAPGGTVTLPDSNTAQVGGSGIILSRTAT